MNNVELLSMYKLEKTAMEGPLEPFPTFKEWKEEYMAEYNETHRSSDLESAVEEIESEVESTLEAIEATEKTTKPVEKTAKTKPVTKKVTKTTKTAKAPAKKTVKKTTVSKMSLARDLFTKLLAENNEITRKEVIARFVSDINLTNAGASTYYQTLKKEMVH